VPAAEAVIQAESAPAKLETEARPPVSDAVAGFRGEYHITEPNPTRTSIPLPGEESPSQARIETIQTFAKIGSAPPDEAVSTVTAVTSVPASKMVTVAEATPTPPKASAESRLSMTDTRTLLARGDALFDNRDIASARLFYERAADAGSAEAAIRLGATFDPSFLARARLTGARGDAAVAVKWYQRARELGAGEADVLVR